MTNTLRIGTRKSSLALWQANWVADQLRQKWLGLNVELIPMTTTGDKKPAGRLADIGGKALFTKEIEEALLDQRVDLAVHSLKDMATILPKGLNLAVVPPRVDPRDVLVSSGGEKFDRLPPGAKVGTSSLRRKCQLKAIRPDLTYEDLRGNIDTRLKKVKNGDVGAIVLAAAGMKRLGFEAEITEYLDLIPAVGQGALALEIREKDDNTKKLISPLDDPATHLCVSAERAFLEVMQGGCQVPLGCHAVSRGSEIELKGFVSDLEGRKVISRSRKIASSQAVEEAKTMAEEILNEGGREILQGLKFKV
ncbi:MAG: hydroxymethylbilane synthase [Deltaproteobacteria bacterium]|nr:hydroxymethylbilane synthase [Deltaproteobacteria bacterium]